MRTISFAAAMLASASGSSLLDMVEFIEDNSHTIIDSVEDVEDCFNCDDEDGECCIPVADPLLKIQEYALDIVDAVADLREGDEIIDDEESENSDEEDDGDDFNYDAFMALLDYIEVGAHGILNDVDNFEDEYCDGDCCDDD